MSSREKHAPAFRATLSARLRAKRGVVFWAKAIQCVLLCAIAVTMLGAVHSQYDRVGNELMCACGCGQILLECNHLGCPASPGMIQELHAQVAGSASDKAILAWFAAKYGPTVLAAPIRGGFDNVAWIVPFAIFALAIVGTFGVVWVWKRRFATTAGDLPFEAVSGVTPHEAALRERIRRETEY
jgi:cytochrome c-type biogenesis protein CcmH